MVLKVTTINEENSKILPTGIHIYTYIHIYIYIYIMRGKKDATTFPDKPVS